MTDVDNLTFFRIVDKQVREAMQKAETGMLPVAKQALADTGISLGNYPVESYYGKSPQLTDYFNHIRTLQLNFSPKVSDSIRRLHNFYSQEVFGLQQAVKTAINQTNVYRPDEPPAVISPVIDPLTIAISRSIRSVPTVKRDLTIENIVRNLKGINLGNGLVGFGVLVDRIEGQRTGKINPLATTLARETTVLSAYVETLRCIPQYLVSPEVEEQGNVVINAYNNLFSSSGFDVRIPNVDRKNAFRLNNDLPEMNRCVRIYNLELPGQDKEYYHWAVGRGYWKPCVVDFWRNEIVTTDIFQKNPEEYKK
ncbi:MAG: hypothetical protein ACP5OG_00865 [Candidatus Nanoarchaeia archaeon]